MRFLSKAVIGGVAVLALALMGMTGCATSSQSNTVTATPAFSPGGGTYNSSQTVTISDATSGAVLYCTTDGTTPTASSPQCSQPTTVFKSEYLQAIAVAPGLSPSAVASAGYTINLTAAATPTFSPAGGTYVATQTVAINDATSGANIFYTTDGTTPTSSSTLYTGPLTVSKSETVSAIAVASGLSNSGVASATYTITPVAATPTFSVAGGTYSSIQTIAIADATTGAAIYYTTNGSVPSASSALYTGPITVSQSETINAIAIASGYASSAVASATYTLNFPAAATPSFSPAAGTYNATQTVTISDATAGASIYYTTNGSVPTASSTPYGGPIAVSTTETLNAIAVAPGFTNSMVATAAYTINPVAATPTISPGSGTYTSVQTVTIGDTTPGAAIYYTTNGGTPTPSSTLYSGPVAVSASETINAIAVASGYANSAIATAAYTINLAPAATPVFSPAAGTFTTAQTVAIGDSTPGAAIYYTTNGSVPTTSSTPYTGPITVSSTETVNAIATASGYTQSLVATAAYTINPVAATPTFSPAPGAYNSVQTVAISDSTAGAVIYYTTNGSTPTTSSSVYAGPIQVSSTESINAIAVANGYTNSAVATATYTLNITATATPTFSPIPGTYTTAQTVTINDATSGASIYYTTNGSIPTTSSTPYTGPITVSSTETIQAIATASGFSNSTVGTGAYTINPLAATPAFSPAAGTYTTAQTVTIGDATSGAAIYYTTDGTTPTTSSLLYNTAIQVASSETIKAIAHASGYTDSTVATAAYTINLAPTPTPTFSPAAGTYTSTQAVTISDTATGAVIYYTTDGSTPTTSSPVYSGPVTVSSTETIHAIALAPNASNSAVATALYTISIGGSTLNGTVLSGSLPVSGAQVQLYAAGQTGYGSTPTALLATAVSTNSSGAFTFTYNCPAAPSDLVYLVATGGDTGTGANADLALMTALGSCSMLTASTQIVVNEATTVASAYALSAFMTASPNVGSSATNYTGLANAFKTVSNLVNIGTGQALSITPAYAVAPVSYLASSTVPQKRINTLANALYACVNTNGTGCLNLFSVATPTAGTAPANTLQAILNIAQNPGNHVSPLYGLASPTGPFQPVLGAAPIDWTMALTFTGAGLGVAPGTAAAQVIASGMAIDATGNLWVTANAAAANGSNAATQLVAEFSNQGSPLTANTTQTSATTAGTTYGGYEPSLALIQGYNSLAIDPSGNIWVAGTSLNKSAAEISPSLSILQSGLVGAGPGLSIAIDGTGGVWVGEHQGQLDQYDNSGTKLSPAGGWPGQSSSVGILSDPLGLAFDSNGGLWAENNDGFGDLDLMSTSTGQILADPYFVNGGLYSPIAADGAGNLYACGTDSQHLDVLTASSMAIVNSYPIATGRGCGGQMVVDGLGHLFAVTGGTTPGIIDEFTGTGTQISPTGTGYTGTSAGEAVTINPDPANTPSIIDQTGANAPGSGVAGAALDGSGNLWVLNADTGASASSPGNVLVEYVGIGAPVVTPTSLGLTNQNLGKRP